MCARCSELENENRALRGALEGKRLDSDIIAARLGLTPTQSRIVTRFWRAGVGTTTRWQICDELDAEDPSTRLPEVHVRNIRRRLGVDAIETIWGSGYRLSPRGLQLVGAAIEKEAA